MNIDVFLKPDKNIVIELEDEVEYLLDDDAVNDIKNKKKEVRLKRLVDGELFIVSVESTNKSLEKNGVIDYLDKK